MMLSELAGNTILKGEQKSVFYVMITEIMMYTAYMKQTI